MIDPSFESSSNIQRTSRLVVTAGVALAIIFLINAFLTTYLLRENTIKDKSDELANLTFILSEHASQTIFSANAALESVLDIVELSKIESEKAFVEFASKKEQFELLLAKTKSNAIIDVSTFVDSHGKVINFSRAYPPPNIDLSDRDYFIFLSKNNYEKTYFSAPVQNKGNGKWVFYLARRVNNSHGQFLGLVLVGVSVEIFSSLYEQVGINLGEGSSISLFRDDNMLLTRWPFVNHAIGTINTNQLIQSSLNSTKRGGVILTDAPSVYSRNQPAERMVSFRAVSGYPFVVGSIMSKDLYLANWYKSLSGVLITTGFTLVTLIAGILLFLHIYRKNARVSFMAHHDVLTELPNRILIADRLVVSLENAKQQKTKFAVMFIDLDNLKTINDSHSHNAGDFALKEVASRMRSCIRKSDTLGRIGGDEFVLILPNIESETDVLQVAEKIRHVISSPILFEGARLSTSASIGIALFPDHGDNEADLMSNADMAMYEAKNSGKNNISIAHKVITST